MTTKRAKSARQTPFGMTEASGARPSPPVASMESRGFGNWRMALPKLSRPVGFAFFARWIVILAISMTPRLLKAEECTDAGEVRRALQLNNGHLMNAEARIYMKQCDNVMLQWRSNRRETVQLPEFGIEVPLVPGKPSEMAFRATMIGRFHFALKNADGSLAPLSLAVEVLPRQ